MRRLHERAVLHRDHPRKPTPNCKPISSCMSRVELTVHHVQFKVILDTGYATQFATHDQALTLIIVQVTYGCRVCSAAPLHVSSTPSTIRQHRLLSRQMVPNSLSSTEVGLWRDSCLVTTFRSETLLSRTSFLLRPLRSPDLPLLSESELHEICLCGIEADRLQGSMVFLVWRTTPSP